MTKSVVVDFTIRLICDEHPDDATKDSINFRYNESTWCADNLIDMLKEAKKQRKGVSCLCEVFQKAEYVKDL